MHMHCATVFNYLMTYYFSTQFLPHSVFMVDGARLMSKLFSIFFYPPHSVCGPNALFTVHYSNPAMKTELIFSWAFLWLSSLSYLKYSLGQREGNVVAWWLEDSPGRLALMQPLLQ